MYIEQNLKTDITAEELAEMANYSAGHFCRLFASAMDSTVASYILKRRLDHALAEIASGRKAIGVVYDYGFDTYAGFYKAFVKMYGCSPKKYLSIYNNVAYGKCNKAACVKCKKVACGKCKNVAYKKSEEIIMQSEIVQSDMIRSEKDILTILENWNIPRGLKIEDISMPHWKTGAIEWRIWAVGEDYFLKTNERSRMIKNIKIAKALKKEGLSSEFDPVPTKDGSDYLDGEHIFLLTKKVGGPLITSPLSDEELAAMDFNDNRTKYAYKLGQAIARLHRALKSVQDDVKPYEANLYQQGINSIPTVKEHLQKYHLEVGDAFFNDYTQIFGELYEKLPKQLIHGNPTGDSVVYEDGEVVGLKGYEIYNASHVRLFDVIWCAGETNTRPIDFYMSTLKEILKGYDSINPLTVEEKQVIYYMLCVASMNCIAYCAGEPEAADVVKRNLNALAFFAENKEMFSNLV